MILCVIGIGIFIVISMIGIVVYDLLKNRRMDNFTEEKLKVILDDIKRSRDMIKTDRRIQNF